MAIDQNSIIPKDLRPLNLNRTAAPPDDPRLFPPRTLELFTPSVDPAIQSPRSGLLLYPTDPNFAPLGFREAAAIKDRPDSDQPSSSPSSSKKVKFLCSIGGKILPRPSDGALRYVGGQTRIVSVRRDVTFRDLVQKMSDVYGGGGGGIAIKYQLPGEDLDALVSVSCAEDLENMMEEYEKLSESDAKLRIFLFTPQSETDPLIPDDDKDVGRRYVEAINGVFERMDSVASTSSMQNSDGPIHVGETLDGFACGRGGDGVTDSRFVFLPPYSVVPAAAPIEAAEVATGSFHPSLGIGTPLYVRAGPYSHIAAHGVKQSAGHHPVHWRAEVQLPPLHPVAVNRCGWHQVAAPVVAETVVRLEDCYMCQKSLPHAHSDTVIQGRHGSASEPQFHSFHSDEVARPWQAHHRVLPVPVLSESLVERKEEQPLGMDLGQHGFQGAEGGAQLGVPVFSVPAPQHEYRTLTALPLDVQAPYGMYLTTTNLPQMCHEHMLHQPPLASTQYQMKPVSVADVNPVRNGASAPESATRDPVTEFIGKHPAFIPREGVPSLAVSHEHVRPINAMIETLHVSPLELNVRPNIDLKQEGLPVVVESGVHLTEPAYTSSAVKIAASDDVREVRSQDDASANPAIVHPPHLSQVGSLHCPLPGDLPQMVYQHFEPLRPR
ncbi:hypothetical protein QJS10_CPA05g01107 [Acorus calamus]|uniref:PB1 domain-containing protein n=1 Tax=Acorus calamus TaxID=4465 RepID=A0AAV9EVS7_ACOCL|nr:hypothetical protein QJS10_CPA05g01107 [Acorus calamus]